MMLTHRSRAAEISTKYYCLLVEYGAIDLFHAAPDFPCLPCISFSNYVFLYLRPSDLPRRWIQCCKLLRVRRTNGVFRHLIGNMPKSCACTGSTNHNTMGKYLSFYKWPVKTSNQYQREQWLQSIVGSRKQSGLMWGSPFARWEATTQVDAETWLGLNSLSILPNARLRDPISCGTVCAIV